jgi:hypothetical protein
MLKNLFKKRKILLLSLVLLLILALVVVYYIDLNRFNSKLVDYNDKYLLKVSYLIGDKDKLDENTTIDKTVVDDPDSILYFADQVIPLSKKGDYLYANLGDFTNKVLLNEVVDIVYSKHNVYAELIDGCSYDKDTKILKIPYSYYENNNEGIPVQVEIESLLKEEQLRNLETNYSVKKLITYSGKEKNELFQLETKISLENYVNGNLSMDNIYAYVNGSSKPADKDFLSYDNNTKVLSIGIPAILINKVDIKIGNNIFKNVFAYANYTYANMYEFKLSEEPGDSWTSGSKHYTEYTDFNTGSSYWSDYSRFRICTNGTATDGGDWCGTYASMYRSYFPYDGGYVNMSAAKDIKGEIPFLARMSFIGTAGLSIDPDYASQWIILACSNHDTEHSDGVANIQLRVTVQAINRDERYMILKIDTYGRNEWGQRIGVATQIGLAYIKVVWEGNNCDFTASKTVNTFNNDTGTAVSTLSLYRNADCSGSPVQTKTIDVNLTNGASGTATFTNLRLDQTYSVKETGFTLGSTNLLTSRYGDSSGCRAVTITDADEDKVCEETLNITNTQRSYCYSIKKVDKENNNTVVNNTTWRLVGEGYDQTVNATNGIATFTGLKYQDYTLYETTANPADLDGNGSLDYWNDNGGNGTTVSASSLTEGSACNNPVTKTDTKVYYCAKVKKVDYDTGETLTGAEFRATKGNITIDKNSANYNTSNGITSFFLGDSSKSGDYVVTETKAPDGYTADPNGHTVTAIALKEYANESAARTACFTDNAEAYDGTTIAAKTYNSNNGNNNYVVKDKKIIINWFKTTENGSTLINGSEFRVKNSSGQFITVTNAPAVQTDSTGTTKACYRYTGTASTGTVMVSGDSGSTGISMTGEVCVAGLPEGTYQVIEIKAPEYHTFGSYSTLDITAGNKFISMTNANKIINYPTEFEFTKKVSNVDGSQEDDTLYTVTIGGVTKTVSLSDMTTEELMKIGFSIYDSNGNVVPVKEVSSGHYEYGSNGVDQGGSGNNITVLHLDSNRKINVKHLPKGTYTIKEIDTSSCQLGNGGYGTIANPSSRPSTAPTCAGTTSSSGECIGYYSPDYSSNTYSFTINDCSSDTAKQNTSSCSSDAGVEVQSLTNIPTEITFTKKDLYNYQNQADIVDNDRIQNSTESSVEFENAKERSDFDRIDFKVKDSNGNYLNFVYVGGSSTTCTSDSDYSIYRYVPGLQLPSDVDPNVFNYHVNSNGLTITQTLHACGGHIKLIGLCRGETYTFEEIRVPDDSVYVLEKQGTLNPEVCFEVPCSTNEEEQRTSKTAIINDKPTRVTFEKRDGKYNYLIPDETTTFEVYRCPKDSLCNPSSYSTVAEREAAGMKLIKFEPKSIITNDEEDAGTKVYRAMSDSDAESKVACTDTVTTNCYVTEVHPESTGKLVLRYLQSGYNYVLLETVAPVNYVLPTGKLAETPFTVVNTTVDVEEVNVPNSPTALIIRKYADKDGDNEADNGELLGGAKFRVYKVNNYNVNRKAKDQDKELISLKTIKEGIYENRPVLDTDIITTCSGDNCSYNPNSLGYDPSQWENIDDLIESSGNNITSVLKEGTALIQYLEYDTYYVIEEVEAPVGYSLPENDDNRFTLVHIKKNETEIIDTRDALVNKPSAFTFYKFDEYNTPLDGATFYLQKLDNEKQYNTLTVSKETLSNGDIIYKADTASELTDITTIGGHATVYYLEPGQYRILEVSAPDGYELPKKTINVATFFVDNDGLVYGSNIITNKKPSDTVEYLASDKAELIINIQTGKVVIKYGLIITIVIGLIVGLIIFLKKRK